LIRVYNLAGIMTELDDAATRKGIFGHRQREANAGATARVAVSAGFGRGGGAARGTERRHMALRLGFGFELGIAASLGYLLLSIALKQLLLPDA
jgi:hypothetical protein